MEIQGVLDGLNKIEHGFKHIMLAGNEIYAAEELDHYWIAVGLLRGESYQARMLGTYILGLQSPKDRRALNSLREMVVRDENWRVQEMLAKAFDHYCAAIGYESAIPEVESWLSDPDPKLNRAVIEGLRIWIGRPYFKEHPEVAVRMISAHCGSQSEYLRKSVGNALRDVWKRHPDLVEREMKSWNLSDPRVAFTAKLIKTK